MKKVKFLVDPLKISGNTVYMTPEQINANSSLMVDNNNDEQRVFYKLKNGRSVISAVDYDDKLYLTTLQLQDYLWQSIRGCEEMSNGSKREEYERLSAKAVSLHNAVLKHNYPHDDGSLSEALASEEDLTILKKIINDKGYYQDLLDSCNEEDRKSVNPVWLDVFNLSPISVFYLLVEEVFCLEEIGYILGVLFVSEYTCMTSCTDCFIPQPGHTLTDILDILTCAGYNKVALIDL